MPQKKISKSLNKVIHDYIDVLRADNLRIKNVFLFGSHAKGTPHLWSDVDLCVISPEFSDAIDAIQYLLSKRILNLKYPIEPIGLHPKHFNEDYSALAQEIKNTGIKIL